MKSLRKQLIAYVLVPVAALTALIFWTTFVSVESLLENRLEKEIELVARSLRMPVEGALRDGDPERLRDALGAVSEIGRVYGAAIYDAEGRRIAVAGDAMPGRAEQIQAAELVAVGEELGQYEEFAGRAVYSYFVPLSVSFGRIDALLQVVREESDIRLRMDRTRWLGLAAMVIGLGLILAVLLVGHQVALMRPVRLLLGDMRRVEQGDRNRRAQVRSPLELAQLAAGLNHMLDALDRAEAEVAQRREMELGLNERMRRHESQAALGRFSAGVAHELGAPLTVIQTDAHRLEQLMDKDVTDNQEGRRRLRRIGEQLSRTRQLVDQLMSLVREAPGQFEPLDLSAVVARAVEGARPEAESRDIALEYDPPAALFVPGLAVRIEHAVLNLVRNAVQAANNRVRVQVGRRGDSVFVTVEDDGPGLEPERRETAFEPFRSERNSGRGTGLGLTIVRTVIEVHGGEIAVASSADLGGCRFEIQLPIEGGA
ncbi:MAG TPA: ATP-binding protein [Wenzhouxiangellaceae bacterium]|nr:ATP-binding protein [Wenzhouxiangellaceae bacterium]HKL52836.1 ATP-binding protein [Wenzhouxiangellaceae bacterium]